MRFRTRLFLAAVGIATVSLLLVAAFVSWSLQRQLLERIETELVAEARLVSEIVSRAGPSPSQRELDAEADRLGADLGARVTLIAPGGRVLADSAEDGDDLTAMENHGTRPEILEAGREGLGVVTRFSTTVERNLLYAAVPVTHPDIAFVRLALPLTAVDEQIVSIQRGTALGLLLALAGALVLAWLTSVAMSRRVSAIATVAKRYAEGDMSLQLGDTGDDEIGTVARALDASVQELGRRMAELSRNRRLTDAIMSSMGEGVLVVDARGYVQMANDAVCEMLQIGGSPLARHYAELIRHPDLAKQIAAALDDGGSSRLEIAVDTEPPKVCLSSATPFVSRERPGVVVVLHDVTDFRRVEQIRQDFVANVSHELRTPLTAIRGSIEALLDAPEVTGDRRFLEIIARHTARMERLVNDLLRLVRLEAGQEVLNRLPCSTASLFAGVRTELAGLLDGKAQRVESRIAAEAGTVMADPAKLHDVLKNLVENASRYAPAETVVELSASVQRGDVVITVADRGAGIPDSDLARVFERFYRVEQSRARDPGGTGLGLSIVKHLVGLHGGTVSAANRPDGGTVFTVRLPRAAQTAEPSALSAPESSRAS